MKIALAITLCLLLTACAGFGMGGMSADQLSAMSKDKSSAAGCTQFTGTGGQFTAFYMNNDKTFNTGGGKTTVQCGAATATFEDSGKSVPKPAP